MADFTFQATQRSADAPDIEAGVYDASFVGVTKKYIEGGMYGGGDRLEWTFALLDDDGSAIYDNGDAVEVNGLTSMSTNTTSKTQPRAVRYLKALMSTAEFAQFVAGEGMNASDLIGRVVQVEVIIKDSGWPSIANVLPPRRKRRATPTVVDEEEDSE